MARRPPHMETERQARRTAPAAAVVFLWAPVLAGGNLTTPFVPGRKPHPRWPPSPVAAA